jgi:hypothetical protein
MSDIRAENCRAFVERDGLIMGVELIHRINPTALFRLLRVDLLDERANGVGGPTIANVAMVDAAGLAVMTARVALCYPWTPEFAGLRFENALPPGNPAYPYQHIITNGYWPPALGPLAIAVLDADGNIISDVIGGLGLPKNHHVSFAMTFREVGAPDVEPGEPGGDYSEQLANIESCLETLLERSTVALEQLDVLAEGMQRLTKRTGTWTADA